MTPAELRARAAALETEARQLRDAADTIERSEKYPGLPFSAQYGTYQPMNASAVKKSAQTPGPRSRGRDITSVSPIGRAATALGLTIKEVAAKLGYSYDTARKWSMSGRVPVDVQASLDKLIASESKRPKR